MRSCHEIHFRRGADQFLLRREVTADAALYVGYRNGVAQVRAERKEDACRTLIHQGRGLLAVERPHDDLWAGPVLPAEVGDDLRLAAVPLVLR